MDPRAQTARKPTCIWHRKVATIVPPPNNNDYLRDTSSLETEDVTNIVIAAPVSNNASVVLPPPLPCPIKISLSKERNRPPRNFRRMTHPAREDACCPCSVGST